MNIWNTLGNLFNINQISQIVLFNLLIMNKFKKENNYQINFYILLKKIQILAIKIVRKNY